MKTVKTVRVVKQIVNETPARELFSYRILIGDLTERNANHIIPSCCHLPVSCRSLVDRFGSPGSCRPQIVFQTNC